MTHPARFTPAILDAISPMLEMLHPSLVFDPFGGTGERLGELCDSQGVKFKGVDIEDWPDKDQRIAIGDATDPNSYPDEKFTIVTSPAYPNGISDHFKPNDTSRRYTYRTALGQALNANNTGRYSIRGGKKAWAKHWELHDAALDIWVQRDVPIVVNVKPFIHKGEVIELDKLWEQRLRDRGLTVQSTPVTCPGIRHGTNRDLRLDNEFVLLAI